ncbi:MAG: alpha-glucan phosphorylase [Candidatus Paceibacter sp.]|jgi:alpha-glucan phosphorylase-like protein|nr:alpha-glucan phosphorylase [Candidatus Paceibacter sp.]
MKPIAFFCAEYGIEEKLPLYAGGLGILSGDFVREAGDEHIPFFAIGLFYSGGFEASHDDHSIQDGHVLAVHGFQLANDAEGKPLVLTVDTHTNHQPIYVQAWTRTYGGARLYLLDTNFEKNTPEHRNITRHLYDSNFSNEMLQEFVLGVGGVKLLRALKVDPGVYHLNEGHTSFAAIALASEYLHDHPEETSFLVALDAVRPQIVASKHTILPGAGLNIEKEALRTLIGAYITRHRIDFDELFALGAYPDATNIFSTTRFLLQSSIRANGVSMLHTIFEHRKHHTSTLIPITNGVYPPNWRSPVWPKEGIGGSTDSEVWQTRSTLRARLVDFVKNTTGSQLDPHALTIVWARRFASYKRPHMLFNDLDRLEKIVSNSAIPVQFIISGNTHEADPAGIAIIDKIKAYISEDRFKNKIVYVPHYSISVARELVAGADVWLNTPERGVEACGTSGMKAGLNGALQCSVSDGWIEEVDWNGIGWVLPEDDSIKQHIYETIEQSIAPCFYDRNAEGLPEQWIKRVRKTMNIVNKGFTTKRMLKDYIEKLYYPGA